jgi:dUTP pyrophosphatase
MEKTFDIYCETQDVYNFYTSIKNHKDDSGFDLYFPEDVTIPGKSTVLVNLQVTVLAKENGLSKAFNVYPRSSIYKTPIRLANSPALIDKGYRNVLFAPLDNISDLDYTIKAGQRLLQCVFRDLEPATVCVSNLKYSSTEETERGKGGLGSTGL